MNLDSETEFPGVAEIRYSRSMVMQKTKTNLILTSDWSLRSRVTFE